MRTTNISIEGYCKIFDDSNVRCVSLFAESLWTPKQKRIEKLRAIGTARKMRITTASDFEALSSSKLPWYKDSSNKLVEWHDVDCINLTVKEAAERFRDNQMGNKIKEHVDNLKIGLTRDIYLISINDLSIKQRLILDGVHRFVALYYLYLENEESLLKLLDSDYGIFLIEFESRVGGVFCPCDFMNLYFNNR